MVSALDARQSASASKKAAADSHLSAGRTLAAEFIFSGSSWRAKRASLLNFDSQEGAIAIQAGYPGGYPPPALGRLNLSRVKPLQRLLFSFSVVNTLRDQVNPWTCSSSLDPRDLFRMWPVN